MLGRSLQKLWRTPTASLFSHSFLSPPSIPLSSGRALPCWSCLASSSCMTQRLYSAKPRSEGSGEGKKGEEFRAIQRKKALYSRQQNPPKLEVPNVATPRGLGNLMGVRTTDILKIMIKLGAEPRDSRDPIDDDLTDMIFEELYFIPERPKKKIDPHYLQHVEKRLPKDMQKDLVDRAPIISVMGHVDHGKTTLLDTLRGASTATAEAGKITQILASFLIEKDGYKMTFLDTPGHAAFTTMREASCFASDLIILVVATDEGVQEQTVESIRIIQEFKKPFILVVTKVDKEVPNMDLIAQQLVRHNVFTDMVGGEVTTLQVSAYNKTGLDDLVDAVVLETEGLRPQAIPTGFAEGVVLESMTSKHKGCGILVMTLWGSLKKGDAVAIGKVYGKIRSLEILEGGRQKTVTEVGPSCPVILYGIKEHPIPGDTLLGAKDERQAKRLVEYRKEIEYDIRDRKELFEAAEERRREREVYFQDLLQEEQGGRREEEEEEEEEELEDLVEVNFVVKANMWGSVVALTDSLDKMLKPHKDELKYQIVKASTGNPSSSDIDIALTTMSHFVCYGVDFPEREKDHLLSKGLKIIQHKVIFSVLTQVSDYVAGLLLPHLEQKVEGEAFVKQLFSVKKKRKTIPVIGCEVQMGKVSVGSFVKVLRNGEEVARGEISGLKHFKDSVKTVKKGQECGVFFTKHKKSNVERKNEEEDGEGEEEDEYDDDETQILPNDVLLIYTVQEKPRKVGEPRRVI